MRRFAYVVVDVFTEVPFAGNPLAVFLEPQGLSSAEMQALARELNLSETAFVFPPERAGSAARVRIFTPRAEIPFAGHPTIGSAFALVDAGRLPASDFVLEENVGPIAIRLERARDPFIAWLRTPPLSFGGRFEGPACAQALGLTEDDLLGDYPVEAVSAGNPFLYVPLRDPATVDRAALEPAAMRRATVDPAGDAVFVFAPTAEGVYARMFAPALGVAEDPATGSATGPLGAYLAKYGLIANTDGTRFRNEQGVKMQRRSLIQGILRMRDGTLETVEVGGSAVRVIEATVTLADR
ncbi:MAG: PhzF family phenazine biosynthesis protein [Candidatus Eremiobacteraeota bacterium]|nr:PhzF family phenazine biosynthesis protein [Candidatus Eremiobacteraeota bacterium]MBC5802551.1 PhzF family phenazine biosynthesis protein [Candidatus Eremiobacteraeota bacterium]MBC5821912.1 PhzF family phenazine biosynthesis protein [Candidatus Eremiobacteraeota bacterium]